MKSRISRKKRRKNHLEMAAEESGVAGMEDVATTVTVIIAAMLKKDSKLLLRHQLSARFLPWLTLPNLGSPCLTPSARDLRILLLLEAALFQERSSSS
jgi:hypothetical protein